MKSILETWQSEQHAPDSKTVEAARVDTARQFGARASFAQAEAGMWKPLAMEAARADLRAYLNGREPSEGEVLAFQDAWTSEHTAESRGQP